MNKGFHEAVCEMVESVRDNEQVEAKTLRDCGFNKRNYHAHYVWCLDPVNTKDFF